MRKKPPKREYALRVNDTAWTVDDRLMAVGDVHFDFVQHRVRMSVPSCLKCSSALFKTPSKHGLAISTTFRTHVGDARPATAFEMERI
jgi:hypothetical protein